MSKNSKTKAKEKRKQAKAARKEANRAKYERWRDLGVNTKSSRHLKNGPKGPRRREHANGECGNNACRRCYPSVHFSPFVRNGQPSGMPRWMYQQWLKAGNGD